MGQLFLASRSDISCHVLCLPADGPAYPLEHAWLTVEGVPCPLLWGPEAKSCLHTAQVLAAEAMGVEKVWPEHDLTPLVQRLRALRQDVWIMTEAEVLDGLHLTS